MGKRHESDAKKMMAQAWNTAALHRSKRMPSLYKLIGDTERPAKDTGEILSSLKRKFGVH